MSFNSPIDNFRDSIFFATFSLFVRLIERGRELCLQLVAAIFARSTFDKLDI